MAADLLQPDAASPGMAVVVHVLSSSGLYTGNEIITTSCPDILVGPSYLSDGTGDPGNPVVGAVLSAVFFVSPTQALGDCTISVDGSPLSENGGVDNLFRVTTAQPAPVDGVRIDAAWLLCLLDGWPCPVLTQASSVVPASTMSWLANFSPSLSEFSPESWWSYRSWAVLSAEGYVDMEAPVGARWGIGRHLAAAGGGVLRVKWCFQEGEAVATLSPG